MTNNITILHNCLIATVPSEITSDLFVQLRSDILASVQARNVFGVIIDMTAVMIIDTFEFSDLMDLARMTALLGAEAVFIGLRPGVVSALVDTDLEFDEILTFADLKKGLDYFTKYAEPPATGEDTAEDTEGGSARDDMANEEADTDEI